MALTEATDLDQIYQELLVDPHWLLYDFNLFQDRCQFLRVNETVYESSLFMDQRLNAEKPQSILPKLSSLLQKYAADRHEMQPVNYLFHIGHCGSTLISRLLGSQPDMLSLREPLPLASLAVVNRQLETEHPPIKTDTYHLLEKFIVNLLSRTFDNTQRVLIKPTSTCCRCANGLMGCHPDSKAVLLFIDLQSYMATMLRFDGNKTETVKFMYAIFTDYEKLGSTVVLEPDTTPVEKLIALNWLVQMAWLTRLNNSRPQNTLLIDFDDFIYAPMDTLKSICELIGIDSTSDALRTSIDWQLLYSYSKVPEYSYDSNARRSILQKSRQEHDSEITRTLAWAEHICTVLPGAGCLTKYLASK